MTTEQSVFQVVRNSLQAGAKTATRIRAETGLPHETVYTALVHLEAEGMAAVVVTHNYVDQPRFVAWGAL